MDAVLYFMNNGCKWRNLSRDFHPYATVANFYYVAIRSGLWENIRAALVKIVRTTVGRNADPNYAIIGSQSVKTTEAAKEHGIDGGKTKGRKRHIVVNTMGNLLAVAVHAAKIYNTKSGILATGGVKDIHLFNDFVPM